MRAVASSPHVLEFLDWVSARERTYGETIEAWRTHCPRLSSWEDAIAAGLVVIVRSNGREPTVELTPKARAALAARN